MTFSEEVLLATPRGFVPSTANIRAADLAGDGSLQILIAESREGQVTWLRDCDTECAPTTLSEGLVAPVRTHVADFDGDGDRDLVVADIGELPPTEERVGRVVLLEREGEEGFTPRVLLDDVGRVACADAADLDADGDLDIVVCEFGHLEGRLLWLEHRPTGELVDHTIDPRPGAIHGFPFDADADGDLDIAAVISQDSEEVLLYRNDGRGGFGAEALFKSPLTYFGMSGIELADLDQDGDTDILVTNGDTFDRDLPEGVDPWVFHEVAWLENDGQGGFAYHRIGALWGAYSARVADFDGDGDLDIAVAGFQVLEELLGNPPRQSVVWFENDGAQQFVRRDLDAAIQNVLAIEVLDFDGDGDPDILAGSMTSTDEPNERLVLFRNLTR